MHDHGHDHDRALMRAGQRTALVITLAVNAAFLVVEVVGGLRFHSLALLADAAHMFTDVAALALALVALMLASRPSTSRLTFGLERAEVLGALVNGLALLAVSAWIVFEAVRRISDPADVRGGGVLAVASIGLVINLVSAVALARVRGSSLNMRGALMHMVADAIGSAGTMAAAVAVILWGATWTDPVVSLAIAALVIVASYRLLADTTHVLLEGVPSGMDRADVEAVLLAEPGIEAVHHLHLWSLASDVPALSAHVVLAGEVSLHEAQQRGDELKQLLASRYGIVHSTLELECHACDDDTH